MVVVILCRKMGWTYTEYMEQPQWFITNVTHLLLEEARDENKK